MATPLSNIYDYFLGKVTDYSFLKLNSQDTDNDGITDLDDMLYNFLKGSIVRFTNCTQDLTVDEVNKQIVSDLTLGEMEILTTLMMVSYVSSKIMNVKNMEQRLTEREYKSYSQANHLKELMSLRKEIQIEASSLMSSYSYKDGLKALN